MLKETLVTQEQKVTQVILVQPELPEKKEIPEQPVKQVLKVTLEKKEIPEIKVILETLVLLARKALKDTVQLSKGLMQLLLIWKENIQLVQPEMHI